MPYHDSIARTLKPSSGLVHLNSHLSLLTCTSVKLDLQRPFIVPQTPEGQFAIDRCFRRHDPGLWTKIEVLVVPVGDAYRPGATLENLPCIRLLYFPESWKSYAEWLDAVTAQANRLMADKEGGPE